jgi:hypothetical protein
MPQCRLAASGATNQETAMNEKSGRFTVMHGVVEPHAQQGKARVAGPLATGVTAFISIVLGASVGLTIPIGVPSVSAAAAAPPSTSQAAYLPSFNRAIDAGPPPGMF